MIGPRKVDRPLVLYGFGKLGHLAKEIFDELDIHSIMIDKNCDLHHVRNPEDCLLAICVATEPYNQVIAPLVAAGWTDIVSVWDIIEAYPEVGIHNGWIERPEDRDDHETYKAMISLSDDLSRQHYSAFIDWRISHYEHKGLAIDVSTTPLSSTLADIRTRQGIITFADTPMIKAVSIHAEGCELKTLEANMYILKKYRPSIECAVYHSRDGLWKIPLFLMDNLPNYRWTFRLHAYQGQAAYIYGCPKERI